MFSPKTERIKKIFEKNSKPVEQLDALLKGSVHMYIDFANVRPWSSKLGWHIDPKRLKQFLDSFGNIKCVKLYTGTLKGDTISETFIKEVSGHGYDVVTKPVKIMDISIDATSIDPQSTALLKQFVRSSLIRNYDVGTIEFLNRKFAEMNAKGVFSIQDRKCNFDVEIGRDMLLDYEKNGVDTYVLWSGDSDFADPIEQLIDDGKQVLLFATARRVSTELNTLRQKGLFVFDIQKIKEFICWKKEMSSGI